MTSEPDIQAVREAIERLRADTWMTSAQADDVAMLCKWTAARLAEPAEAGKGEACKHEWIGGYLDPGIAGKRCKKCGLEVRYGEPTPAPAPEMVEVVARIIREDVSIDIYEALYGVEQASASILAAAQSAGYLVAPGMVAVPVAAWTSACHLERLVRHEVLPALRPGNVSLRADIEKRLSELKAATPSAQPQGDRHG
jgi:hypothetical protein